MEFNFVEQINKCKLNENRKKYPKKKLASIILVISIKKVDDYKNINRVNSLYLIIGNVDGYIEENNGNRYLVFTSTDGNKRNTSKVYKTLRWN